MPQDLFLFSFLSLHTNHSSDCIVVLVAFQLSVFSGDESWISLTGVILWPNVKRVVFLTTVLEIVAQAPGTQQYPQNNLLRHSSL